MHSVTSYWWPLYDINEQSIKIIMDKHLEKLKQTKKYVYKAIPKKHKINNKDIHKAREQRIRQDIVSLIKKKTSKNV